MKKLTREEKRLLQNPPTPMTWYCGSCGITNNGKNAECWNCGSRVRKSERPWEVYQAALLKKESLGPRNLR